MALNIFADKVGSLLAFHVNSSLANMYKSMEKLSSGYRINSAADGPAQLVISEQLRAQIASLNQEIENTNSLIYKYQTGSSAVMGLRSQLTELRTLAVGAANEGVNNEEAQQAYQAAADCIVNCYNDTIANAEYNGAAMFDGSSGSLGELSNLDGIDLSSAEAAAATIDRLDEAIAEVDGLQTELGATQRYELESHLASLRVTSQNLQAAESNIRDTDYGMEYSRYVAEQIRFNIGLALFSHMSMNSNSVLGLIKSS